MTTQIRSLTKKFPSFQNSNKRAIEHCMTIRRRKTQYTFQNMWRKDIDRCMTMVQRKIQKYYHCILLYLRINKSNELDDQSNRFYLEVTRNVGRHKVSKRSSAFSL